MEDIEELLAQLRIERQLAWKLVKAWLARHETVKVSDLAGTGKMTPQTASNHLSYFWKSGFLARGGESSATCYRLRRPEDGPAPAVIPPPKPAAQAPAPQPAAAVPAPVPAVAVAPAPAPSASSGQAAASAPSVPAQPSEDPFELWRMGNQFEEMKRMAEKNGMAITVNAPPSAGSGQAPAPAANGATPTAAEAVTQPMPTVAGFFARHLAWLERGVAWVLAILAAGLMLAAGYGVGWGLGRCDDRAGIALGLFLIVGLVVWRRAKEGRRKEIVEFLSGFAARGEGVLASAWRNRPANKARWDVALFFGAIAVLAALRLLGSPLFILSLSLMGLAAAWSWRRSLLARIAALRNH